MRPSAFGRRSTVFMAVAALSLIHGRIDAISQAVQGESASVPELLARAATYLEGYERKLPSVTAEEDYVQNARRGTGSLVLRFRSDIMLMALGNSEWVEFRDVFELNMQPVRDHTARLMALLDGPPSEVLQKAQRIADESARFNIGVQRNINVPLMALAYLTRANQSRSTFRLAGTASVRGTRAAILQFKETASPPLIHTPHGTVETSGRFWLAPDNGAVLKTELSVKIPPSADVPKDKRLDGVVTVEYKNDDHASLLVPVQMDEKYDAPPGVGGRATYSHYQAFGVNVSTRYRGGGD